MMRTLASAALAAALLPAGPARAHPHIFIDTGLAFVHDAAGRVTALEIRWTYDELFSLLMLEDLGLDDDYDGQLRPDEVEALQGFDMDWPEGYEGDVYLEVDGAAAPLGPPVPGEADLLANGMLTATHVRPLAAPVDPEAASVVVKVYDPTFYTAYTILPEAVSTPEPDCSVAVFTPDMDAAYAFLEAALEEMGARIDDPFVEQDFPPVGDRFSEEVRLTCGDRVAEGG
jgi:ABC-type uncharacterized transport system substrate-binding protein